MFILKGGAALNVDMTKTACVLTPEQEQDIYCTMMDLSTDVVFEWNRETDRLTCSSKWFSRFGYTPLCDNFFRSLSQASHLHPDDLVLLQEQLDAMERGQPFGEAIVRIRSDNDRYAWNRIRASAQYDNDGKLQKLVGVITDIDTEQRNSQALLAKTEQDSLTGLLNKDAARRRIGNYLSHAGADQLAAMLIIDLDNFKSVNDQFGHLFGDAVLSRVAATIRSLFREKDITARIGGDEFLVFMMDIPDWELAMRRCDKLIKALQTLYDGQLQNCQFSCSIGIAIMPDHGAGYQELFQRADRALYQAKNLGKNTFCCYAAHATPSRYETKINHRIESDEVHKDSFGPLAAHMLEQLYETRDLSAAITTTLDLIGTQLQADRIFISDAAGEKYYIWHSSFFTGTPDAEQPLREAIRSGAVHELFGEEDLYYCHDTGTLPEALQTVARMSPSRLVYISCNPATLARDLARLSELGYMATKIQPVDMFPRTAHVESVVCLTRKE